MQKCLFKKTLFLSFFPIIALLAFSGCERPEIKKMEKPMVEKPLPSRKISWAPWNKEIAGRTPLVERTLVFPRAQLKYGLDGRYLHLWVDRPLLCDRSFRLDEQKWSEGSCSSYRRTMEVLKDLYEVDGLGFLAETGGRINVVKQTDQANMEGFYLLPALGWKSSVTPKQDEVLKTVLASKSAFRINGKVPIPIYGRHVDAEKWKPFLKELRAKYTDKFLFIVALYCPPEKGSWSEYIKKFLLNNNSLPPEDLETIREYWRSYLDVADGVYHGEVIYSGEEGLYGPDQKYCGEFHQKVIAPILVELLSDPKYRTKYLFCSAGVGYFRPGPGVCRSEDGTKTLRQSFEGAMASNPDVIVMAEWDEENENTCVRPTVYNSFSTQRIIKYYLRRLKGEKPAPNPGDDLSFPNLIVSYRKILSLGEPLEVELLNVPDSAKDDFYSVTLTLRALNGALVKSFPARSFLMNELKDHTLIIPSEELAGHLVLIPSLEITDSQGQKRIFQEGLHHILLRATWNWDYKWVKQPLRDICRPTKASFAFAAAAPGVKDSEKTGTVGRDVTGVFECDEKIASVEIVEDGDEVYAVDPDDEYGRAGNNLLLCIEWRSWLGGREWGTAAKEIRGTLTARNTDIKRVGTLVIKPDQYTVEENSIELKAYVSDWIRKIFIAIPEKDKEKAVLDFDVDVFPKAATDSTPPIGKIKFNVPLKQIMAGNGVYAKAYEGGMNITISKYDKLPDHPFHIGEKNISFHTTIYPETPTSVFQMRVITKSGKAYWSPPLLPSPIPMEDKVRLNVYSDTAKKVVTVDVPGKLVPDIIYDFTPEHGATLHASEGRPFCAALGGLPYSCTGRGGLEDGTLGFPFNSYSSNRYPGNATKMAPEWVEEDGVPCLKFDGIGNYICFPEEMVPRRGSYHLSFEIKPASLKPQVLFNHFGDYIGSLTVRMDKGKLSGSFTRQDGREYSLKPDVSVEIGNWNKVEIVYDLENIVFIVNGKKSAPIPCPGPGVYTGTSVFGGFGKGGKIEGFKGNTGWFEGYLKSMRIRHSSFD